MIYGTPQFKIDHDVTDRIGIRTLVLGKIWEAPRSGMSIQELDEAMPAPPVIAGGLFLIGRQTQPRGGGLRTAWTFEGVDGDGKSVSFKDRRNSLDYEFSPGFAQVSILRHPRFRELQADYEGFIDQDGSVFFPQFIKGKQSARGLGGASAGGEETSNPLFGETDFLRMEGTYAFRYASFEPASESHVGKLFTTDSLPGRPPNVGEGRNWLGAPSKSARRGPVFEIIESYWLSGEGGWPEPIYGKGASPYTKGGLTTGSLRTGSL